MPLLLMLRALPVCAVDIARTSIEVKEQVSRRLNVLSVDVFRGGRTRTRL